MPVDKDHLNAVIGDVLKGEYTKRGQTLESIASSSGIPYSTLRKKIAGDSPIFATELLAITKAISVTLDPGEVLDEAQRLSAATATTDPLTKKRQEKARAMTLDQIEDQGRAATIDREMDTDESPPA